MNEANHFEALMQDKHKGFEVDDRIEQAYRQGYEAGRAQIEEKHWNECRQISEYQAENKRLKELLFSAMKNLNRRNCTVCDVEMLSPGCRERTDGNRCFKWKYEAEALELIGGKRK